MSAVPIAVDITPAVVSLSSASLDAPPVVIRPPATPFAAEARTLALDLPLPLEHEIERPRGMSARQRAVLKRVLEIVPFVVALTVISFLVWGPLFVPVPFAICIISFQAYWLWRAQMTGIHAFKGFLLLRRHKKVDWREQYYEHLAAGRNALKWDDVRHIVVIPNYTESAEKLRLCLDSLAQCEVPEKVIAVLAMEEREGAEGRRRAEVLIAEYRSRLGGIFATYHPWGVPGEVAGKASNENWAARRAKQTVVDRWGYDLDLLTITSCDADTVFDRKYFSCLTYNFATNPNRYRRFWQGPIMYYNNIWDVPAPLRLPHAIAGLNHLGRLSRTLFRNVFPQSTYSLSLRMAHEVDYWDPDTIPEDWHMFLTLFFLRFITYAAFIRSLRCIEYPTGTEGPYERRRRCPTRRVRVWKVRRGLGPATQSQGGRIQRRARMRRILPAPEHARAAQSAFIRSLRCIECPTGTERPFGAATLLSNASGSRWKLRSHVARAAATPVADAQPASATSMTNGPAR